jgi:hypothetical protein
MRLAGWAIWATALTPLTALAQTYVLVTPPHHHAEDAPADTAGGQTQTERLHSTLNRVFGAGQWRETSGYRSPERENELRREGAGTVPEGQLSRHSMGTPDAPGAYDVVVAGMSTEGAAQVLRRSGEPFVRVLAEGAHGPEGSHLHIEPGTGLAAAAPAAADLTPKADPGDSVYLRVTAGHRNPVLTHRR